MSLDNPKRNGIFKKFTEWHLRTRPVVYVSDCTACARCKKACPTKAIEFFGCMPLGEVPRRTGEPRHRPEVDYKRCTRCYRCKEICPQKAMDTHKPLLMRVLRL